MGFINKHTSILVMLLGIFVLTFAPHADAQLSKTTPNVIINPYCTEGENVSPALRALCTKMVGNAKTWDQAAISSLRRISRKADRSVKPLLASIEAKLAPSNMPLSEKASIIETCTKSFQEVIEDLQKCPKLITVGPFTSYATTLTSIYTSFEDCKDAVFNKPGQPELNEVTRFTKSIHRLLDVALIVSKKDPRIADYKARLARGEFNNNSGGLFSGAISSFYGAKN